MGGYGTTSGPVPFSITIPNPVQPITITPTSLNPGQVGVPYPSTAFTAVGGTGGGYTWSESGALGGLSFSGGVLSGTPTTPGLYNPTFTVTDSGSNTQPITLPLTINPAAAAASGITLSTNLAHVLLCVRWRRSAASKLRRVWHWGTGEHSTRGLGGNWLTATPPTGTTLANVSVGLQNPSLLNQGTWYQGNVVVQPQGSLSPQSVAVTLQVASPQPVLGISSTDLRFPLVAGSPATLADSRSPIPAVGPSIT